MIHELKKRRYFTSTVLTLLLGFLGGLCGNWLVPLKYESTAILKIHPSRWGELNPQSDQGAGSNILSLQGSASSAVEEEFARILEEEVARLRKHFDAVLSEIGKGDIRHLAPRLVAERDKNIRRLREYRDRGIFPINDTASTERIPIFRDTLGTRCAVAYLMWKSGRDDLVSFVSKTNNFVYVRVLRDGPALDWIRGSGLTLAECARIQPMYKVWSK